MANVTDADALVGSHLALVTQHVRQVSRRLPAHVDRDDLTAAGLAALVIAARAHDPDLINSFASFAGVRIRWALMDELRSLDWAPRSARVQTRRMNGVRLDLIATLERIPTSAELAGAMGMTTKDLAAITQDEDRASILSLQGLAPYVLVDALRDRQPGPEDVILFRERIGYLRDAVASLPTRSRLVVVRHFLQERPMAEIAAELGVTDSRVSQLCAEALAMLRDGINAQLDPDLVPPDLSLGRSVVMRRRAEYHARIAAGSDLRGRLAVTGRVPVSARRPVRRGHRQLSEV
jgi:RNA polymerase sigma factor for flagellar operon FliA